MDILHRAERAIRGWAGALVVAAALPLGAQAQLARMELQVLSSSTPSDQDFLTGRRDAKPVALGAELRLPRPGVDRLPAVLLLHGSGGPGALEDQWAREFAAWGVATLIVDSFTARGVPQTVTDQDQLSRLAMVGDAYRALELLARHPRIDPTRIVVMGFSRGGGAAHWAAIQRFQALHGPAAPLGFAGFIAMYPTCNRAFLDAEVVDKPIRIFHGLADDYIPSSECRAYVDRLRAAGKDIVMVEYPGAHHVFDNAALRTLTRLPQAQTTRACPMIEETAERRLVNSQTRQPFTYATDPCVQRGTTIGYNAEAHVAAVKEIRDFLGKVLRLP